MNAYFFKMNQAERNDILDQHRKVYDGFVTSYGQQINQQPLYVQDYANDKEGLTVSNKGVVKSYTNMNINEANAMTGSKYVPSENIKTYSGGYNPYESEYKGAFDGKDRIVDNPTDLSSGTTDLEDDDVDYVLNFEIDSEDPEFEDVDVSEFDTELDLEKLEPLQEQVNKTLDMFKRFKNF
jgi:hypothetical protein